MENEPKPQEQTPQIEVKDEPVVTEPKTKEPENTAAESDTKKVSKLVISIIAVVVMLLAVGTYLFAMSGESETEEEKFEAQASEELPINEEEELDVPNVVQWESALYPTITLNIFEGWTVEEPDAYADDSYAANADILLKNGDFEVTLPFITAISTGFTNTYCYADPQLQIVSQLADRTHIRYEREDAYYYASVRLEGSDNFDYWIDGEGQDFVAEKDEGATFCLGDEPIAVNIESAAEVLEDDFLSQDSNGNGFVDAWLMKVYSNNTQIDDEKLSQLDAMIGELLQTLN